MKPSGGLAKCFEMLEREAGQSLSSLRHALRKVRVEFVSVEPGELKVKLIQGKQKPCFVKMALPVLSEAVWEKVLRWMSREAGWAAALSSGVLPQDFEKVYRREGVRLFPAAFQDFEIQCSADAGPVRPCKHALFAWLLFLTELEKNPLLILTLRGKPASELLERLTESQTLKKPGGFPLQGTGADSAFSGELEGHWRGTAAWARQRPFENESWFEGLKDSGWLWKGQDVRLGLLTLMDNVRRAASKQCAQRPDGLKTGEAPASSDGILPA